MLAPLLGWVLSPNLRTPKRHQHAGPHPHARQRNQGRQTALQMGSQVQGHHAGQLAVGLRQYNGLEADTTCWGTGALPGDPSLASLLGRQSWGAVVMLHPRGSQDRFLPPSPELFNSQEQCLVALGGLPVWGISTGLCQPQGASPQGGRCGSWGPRLWEQGCQARALVHGQDIHRHHKGSG